jgi:hypothetical protein
MSSGQWKYTVDVIKTRIIGDRRVVLVTVLGG